MTDHFAGRKLVVRDEMKRRKMVADWGMRYSAGLDNCFARWSVDHLVDLGTFDSAAARSCPAVAYDGCHDLRPGARGKMDYSGYRHCDLTSCSVHIRAVMWWNVKSSDRTARTLKPSDRVARCGPKSWYLHHLALPAAVPAAASLHIAYLRDQLHVK